MKYQHSKFHYSTIHSSKIIRMQLSCSLTFIQLKIPQIISSQLLIYYFIDFSSYYIKPPTFMNQTCMTCDRLYDYDQKVATAVCADNHVVCKQCAQKLFITKSKCPFCLSPLTYRQSNYNNPYNIRESENPYAQVNEPMKSNNQYQYQQPQPPYKQPQPQYQQPQPQYQQPQNIKPQYHQPQHKQPQYQQAQYQQQVQYHQQVIPNQNNNPPQNNYFSNQNQNGQVPFVPQRQGSKVNGVLVCCMVFFIIFMIGCIATRVQQQTCQYWGYSSCSYYGYLNYCCLSYSYCNQTWISSFCDPLWYYQNQGTITATNVGIGVFSLLTVICLIKLMTNRRRARAERIARGNYVRV